MAKDKLSLKECQKLPAGFRVTPALEVMTNRAPCYVSAESLTKPRPPCLMGMMSSPPWIGFLLISEKGSNKDLGHWNIEHPRLSDVSQSRLCSTAVPILAVVSACTGSLSANSRIVNS